MAGQKQSALVTGLVFILVGAALYGVRFVDRIGHFAVLTLLGALFLGGYFYAKRYGLLVAGCILTGVGVGFLEDRALWEVGDFKMLALGVAFVAIWAISLLRERKSRWWPLVPGAILILLGFGALRSTRQFLFSREGWPVLFVIIGVLIVIASLGARGGARSKS